MTAGRHARYRALGEADLLKDTPAPRKRPVQATVKFMDGPMKGDSSTLFDPEIGMLFLASKPNGTVRHKYEIATVEPVPERFGAFATARYRKPPAAPKLPKP